MAFIVLGVLFIIGYFTGIGPSARWNWALTGDLWKFLISFVLALIWWAWADASGHTRRKEMKKEAARKEARRRKNIEALGLTDSKDSRLSGPRSRL